MIPGLSAMLRVKNEERWIGYCLDSILPWFDEIVICLQNCTDDTEMIVRTFDSDKIKVYHYEHDSWPNGEGYSNQDVNDPRSRTYFYNWCLNKTTREYVCKWDADMVAHDWLGDEIHRILETRPDAIYMFGTDIVGQDLRHVGAREHCATEPRVFRHTPRTRYVNGKLCERLETPLNDTTAIHRPAFLHFKWAKPLSVATQAWPDGWEAMPHFRDLLKRAIPAYQYTGEYPSTIRSLVK